MSGLFLFGRMPVSAHSLTRYTAHMLITTRRKATAFFIVLGSTLVAIALALNIGWIIKWREAVPLVVGIVLFALIIAGLIINTIFLVREIRRNEQHDSFINAVTHELKTPIASIRLFLETLQSRKVTEAQRQEFYQLMHRDTDRLTTTVDQVLRAAETVQKRVARNWSPINIATLLHARVELARQTHQLSHEQLIEDIHTSDHDLLVMGDAEELQVAISNLLDNAIKYSPEVIHIEVTLLAQASSIQIRVADQGVGIPRSDLKHIFKRFFRTGRARNKFKGTGLGLFIVQAIIKKHHGSVVAESEGEGKGAVMTLRLPRLATS